MKRGACAPVPSPPHKSVMISHDFDGFFDVALSELKTANLVVVSTLGAEYIMFGTSVDTFVEDPCGMSHAPYWTGNSYACC